MLYRSHYLLYLILLLPLCSSATAFQRQTALKIDVVAEDGRVYPVYDVDTRGKPRTHRAWLEAVNGQHYAVRIQNRSHKRVGLVIAIDGRNIISGQKSNLTSNERMYILNPWETASYDGWRTSNHKVNQFFFTEAENSYAGAWQDHSAMGVIAVAAFDEHRPYRSRQKKSAPYANERSDAPASVAGKAESSRDMKEQEKQAGTGFGEEKYSYVKVVSFKPMKTAMEKHFYKYEWRETLCQQRIVECNLPGPNRFWPEHENYYGYAPYPPG
ncbi:MAG: hypothetical protein HN764_06840 [Gammaproteobacteria bacterium]|jgi:hypothetical protein|nr:hypothetical protein [Gammaproteobacteria bacterium]